jgi:sporulation protein YlmC with PRC-barrel domain
MNSNRNRQMSRTIGTRATPFGSGMFSSEWMLLLMLLALTLLWPTVVAADASGSAGKAEAVFPASRLIGKAVNDSRGQKIAEIEDLVMNREGAVKQAILSTGGVAGIGEKLVAVPFGKLILDEQWNKRSIRTQSGTTVDVNWEKHLEAVYREGADTLRKLPEYTYEDEHYRGGPSGWGVYSYPAGPSQPAEVTQPQEVTGGSPQ